MATATTAHSLAESQGHVANVPPLDAPALDALTETFFRLSESGRHDDTVEYIFRVLYSQPVWTEEFERFIDWNLERGYMVVGQS